MRPIDQAIFDIVTSRKRQLMRLRPAELRELPKYASEEFDAVGRTQLLSVYHDKTPQGEDLFVAQCKRRIFMGFGFMFAEGFVLDSSGQTREPEEELMWDYR